MWNESKLQEYLKELKEGARDVEMDGGILDDNMAFDIADGCLAMEEGLEDYLRNKKGIQDPQGYLANHIY